MFVYNISKRKNKKIMKRDDLWEDKRTKTTQDFFISPLIDFYYI